jgi:serine/threonine protein kinase
VVGRDSLWTSESLGPFSGGGDGVSSPSSEPNSDLRGAEDWSAGRRVAENYVIRRVLGRGGFGVVYLADDIAMQRRVAVKVPLGRFMDEDRNRRGYLHEAEAWMRLVHPHIVTVVEVRDDRSTDYRPAVIMEYCDAGSVADRLMQGRCPSLPEVLDIMIQVAWAMAYAHERGFVHRDLKPGNVLITSNGRSLVSDFGLARRIEWENLGADDESPRALHSEFPASVTCGIAGTPPYMPPEQWDGEACPLSDVYAFGVMLYELSCGRHPFTASSGADYAALHRTAAPPDPLQWNGTLPPGLRDIMLNCLAKEPSCRPSGFAKLATLLEGQYEHQTGLAHSDRRGKPAAQELSRHELLHRAWSRVQLGNGFLLRGDLQEAEKQYTEAEALFQQLHHPPGIGIVKGRHALVLRARGQLDEALALHHREEEICRDVDNKEGLQVSLGHQALIRRTWGQLDTALALLKNQEQLCRDLGNDGGLQESLGHQATIRRTWGQLDEALTLLKEQEEICRALDDRDGLRISLGSQALIANARGQLDEAMALHRREEELCRDLGNRDGLQTSLGNQASILRTWGRLDEALAALNEQELICRELENREGLQFSLGLRALILRERGQLDEALTLHLQEEQICRELRNQEGLAACMGNQALIHQARGQLDKAWRLFCQQELIWRELRHHYGLAATLGNKALVLQSWGRLEEALSLHQQEEQICLDLQDKAGLAASLGNQSLIFRAWGRLDKALALHVREEQLYREMNNKDGLRISLGNRASILQDSGQLEEAMALHEQEKQICLELRSQEGLAACLGNEALIRGVWGQLDEAMMLHREEGRLYGELGDFVGLAVSLAHQAMLLARLGQRTEALSRAHEAIAHIEGHGMTALESQIRAIPAWVQSERGVPESVYPVPSACYLGRGNATDLSDGDR